MKAELILINPIVRFFVTSGIIALFFVIIAIIKKADIIVSPIKGFVLGALVHADEYQEDKKQFIEYTLQAVLGFISITVIWERQIGLKK